MDFPRDEDTILINFNDEFFSYNFNPETRNLLNLIQENRVLRNILHGSPMDDLKIFKALALLKNVGILRVKPVENSK